MFQQIILLNLERNRKREPNGNRTALLFCRNKAPKLSHNIHSSQVAFTRQRFLDYDFTNRAIGLNLETEDNFTLKFLFSAICG